jgi:DNA topoisomerase IB
MGNLALLLNPSLVRRNSSDQRSQRVWFMWEIAVPALSGAGTDAAFATWTTEVTRFEQYRYHPNWREVRDQVKYDQILAFAAALPALRRRLGRDLAAPGLSKRKVVAAVVQLLEKTFIRVGNDEYARQNQSFGLTTMRNGHVRVSRSTLRFRFRGKSGKTHDISFDDRRLALIVRRCQELPGHELFEYLDEHGNVHGIGSADVNDYLREATGQDFTAKSFRTWAGTLLVARALQELPPFQSSTQGKRNIVKAVEAVAGLLGNTPAVCRSVICTPRSSRHTSTEPSFARWAEERSSLTPFRRLLEIWIEPRRRCSLCSADASIKTSAGLPEVNCKRGMPS